MSSAEDEIVNAKISKMNQVKETNDLDVELVPEARYNHYGDRGVVDLYISTGDYNDRIIEVKSEDSVRGASGANEIIRQFNKMVEYFYKGSDYEKPRSEYPTTDKEPEINYMLIFELTEHNVRHLVRNWGMYSSTSEEKVIDKMKRTPKMVMKHIKLYSVNSSTEIGVGYHTDSEELAESLSDEAYKEFREYADIVRDEAGLE